MQYLHANAEGRSIWVYGERSRIKGNDAYHGCGRTANLSERARTVLFISDTVTRDASRQYVHTYRESRMRCARFRRVLRRVSLLGIVPGRLKVLLPPEVPARTGFANEACEEQNYCFRLIRVTKAEKLVKGQTGRVHHRLMSLDHTMYLLTARSRCKSNSARFRSVY